MFELATSAETKFKSACLSKSADGKPRIKSMKFSVELSMPPAAKPEKRRRFAD
ncbi:MAG: hypothetical protein HKL90_03200 [Elusimicrobia bacterium]|nr:hypothetical protein [Elusimicrobiota bacterium]